MPWRSRKGGQVIVIGFTVLTLTALTRLVVVLQTPTALTLPEHRPARWVNTLIDEQDVTLFAERTLALTGMILPEEDQALQPALQEAYATLKAAHPDYASPFVGTYLGWQSPEAFDSVLFDLETNPAPRTGVIFLHGFTGNFTLQCWLMAQAAQAAEAITICPSADWTGAWWTPQGQAIVSATLTYFKQRGIEHIYLAGLSNGGIGANHIAPHVEVELDGLILISGADPAAPVTTLPTLIVHGDNDRRIPASIGKLFAEQHPAQSTYIEFEGDHFVLVKRKHDVQSAIADWLKQQQSHPN